MMMAMTTMMMLMMMMMIIYHRSGNFRCKNITKTEKKNTTDNTVSKFFLYTRFQSTVS